MKILSGTPDDPARELQSHFDYYGKPYDPYYGEVPYEYPIIIPGPLLTSAGELPRIGSGKGYEYTVTLEEWKRIWKS